MIGRHSVERGGVRRARRVVDRRELILCLSYLRVLLVTQQDYLQVVLMTQRDDKGGSANKKLSPAITINSSPRSFFPHSVYHSHSLL